MNPARAFGPELLGNFWGEGWIYTRPGHWVLIAAFAYDYLYLRPLRPVSSERRSRRRRAAAWRNPLD